MSHRPSSQQPRASNANDITAYMTRPRAPVNPMALHGAPHAPYAVHQPPYFVAPGATQFQPLPQVPTNIVQLLEAQQESLRDLSKAVEESKTAALAESKKVSDDVKAAHGMQMQALRKIAGRVERLEKLVGEKAAEDGHSLTERLDAIEFAVGDLTERAKDPDAGLPEIIRHEVGIDAMEVPVRQFADACQSPMTPQRVPSSPPSPRQGTAMSLPAPPPPGTVRSIGVPGHAGESSGNSAQGIRSTPQRTDIHVRALFSIQSHFSSPPSPSSFTPHALNPVDWSNVPGPSSTPSRHSSVDSLPPFIPSVEGGESFRLMPRRAPDGTVASLRRDGGLLHLQTALAPVPCLPSPPETQGAFSTSPELDTGMMLEDNDDLPNEDPNAPQEDTALGRGIDSLSVLSELPEALANMSEGGDKGEQLVKQEAAGPDPTSYSRASSLSSLSTLEDSDDPDQRSVTPTQRRARRQSTRLVKASASSASTSKKRKSIAPEGSAKRVKRSKSYKREAVEWPARTGEIGEFQRTFIQCDKCDSWYHYGCVGIVLGDPRLRADSTEMFVCPPCDSGVVNGNKGRKGKKGAQTELCMRPTCFHPTSEVGEEFVVERLVGRRERKEEGRKGFLWLIQWEGYPISQATWTPEEHMGYFAKLQEDFYEAAAAEGLDVDDDTQTLLLQDATDGGWQ